MVSEKICGVLYYLIAAGSFWTLLLMQNSNQKGKQTFTIIGVGAVLIICLRWFLNVGLLGITLVEMIVSWLIVKEKCISFSVKRHQKIAITGENGSGKTTLIKLLLGLEKANSGTICINGICMNDLEIKSIRNVISCVPQNIFLFADSLWNNITMGLKSQTEEDIVNACQVACLDEFLSELPMGFATFVEENGSNFSAGQKQAIAIARAMVRKPDLLILDEATSNMDQEKEKK